MSAVHDVVVNAVFDVGSAVVDSPQAMRIGFVLGEEQLRRAFAMQPAVAGLVMIKFNHRVGRQSCLMQLRTTARTSPRPGVAEPHRRQQAQIGCFRATVGYRDFDQDVFGVCLGIFHEDIKVAIVVEYSGIEQFELRLALVTSPVFFHQMRVRKLRLRILVQILHVGVRRRRVEVEVALLHILAMIALVSRQAEKPFLQDGIALVPQRHSKTDHLPPIADARQPIFVPAIGA